MFATRGARENRLRGNESRFPPRDCSDSMLRVTSAGMAEEVSIKALPHAARRSSLVSASLRGEGERAQDPQVLRVTLDRLERRNHRPVGDVAANFLT